MNSFIKFTQKAYWKKLVVMLLILSNILSGCTNLVTGDVKTRPIDWTDVDDKSGITALDLKNSDRIRVKINYGDAADFDANKYSALYLDAFYVAPDLSNDLENVSYFELLDTFDNQGKTTFVYAYRTRKYAGKKERDEKDTYTTADDGGADLVMYPEVKEDSKIPTSEEVYLVLATYSFEQGRSSYRELARIVNKDAQSGKVKTASDVEDKYCYAKTSYTQIGDSYSAKYYSVLDDTTLYVFDAENVKAFAKNDQPCCRLNNTKYETVVANEGGTKYTGNNGKKDYAYTTSYGTNNFSKSTKYGFSKKVDFADEFSRLTGSEAYKGMVKGQFGKDWTMDIYDYSIYTQNKEMNICFDLTVTSANYEKPKDSEFEDPVNPDGTPKTLDDDDEKEMTDEEIKQEQASGGSNNWSYDFVGNIVIKDMPRTHFNTNYYYVDDEHTDLNYLVYITDYADANGEPLETISENALRSLVGAYGFIINKDGSAPLNMIRRPPKSGFFAYFNKNGTYFGFPSNYGFSYENFVSPKSGPNYEHIGDITGAYNQRDADNTKEYKYSNKEYLLVRGDYFNDPANYNSAIVRKDSDGKVYNTIITNNYIVGDLELESTQKYIEENVAQPQEGKIKRVYTGPFAPHSLMERLIGGSIVMYNAIPGLKMEMKKGVLHSMVMYQPNDEYTGKYIYDNYAVFRKKDRVTHLTNLTGVAYSSLLNLGFIDYFDTDLLSPNDNTGNLQSVEPVLIGNQLYLYYIYEKAIEIVSPKVNTSNYFIFSSPTKKAPSLFRTSGNSFYKYIDTTKFCIDKSFKTSEVFSIGVDDLVYVDDKGNVINGNKIINSMDNIADNTAVDDIHTNRLNNGTGLMESFYYDKNAIKEKDVNHNGTISKDTDPGITAEYTIEGIVYHDRNGADIGKLTYDQALSIVSGNKTIDNYLPKTEVAKNWTNKSLVTDDNKTLADSLKDNGLAYRYEIKLESEGDSVVNCYIYDTINGVKKEVGKCSVSNNELTASKDQLTDIIKGKRPSTMNIHSWNSIANYIATKLSYRYAVKLEDAGNSVIKYHVYDTVNDVYKEVAKGEFNSTINPSKTESAKDQLISIIKSNCPKGFDTYSWNTIANQIASMLSSETKTETSSNYKALESGEYFKAANISFFNGNFEDNSSNQYRYIVSSTPKYGLGLLNTTSDTPILPTFQRHEIVKKVTHIIEKTDGQTTGITDQATISGELKMLSNMACYGIYKNNYTKDKDIYPYYYMGYDRDGISYTSVEMLRAKMVPFGIAFYDESKDERVNPSVSLNEKGEPYYTPNTGKSLPPEHRYGYYRDYQPVGDEKCVFYLRDAYFEPNGNMIVDRNIIDGDDPIDDDDPNRPKPSPTADPGPTIDPNPTVNPTPTIDPNPTGDPTPTIDPNPSGKPGPTVDPNPSKKPGPTVDPNPSGKPGPTVDPNPSGKPGPTVDPNPSGKPTPTIDPNPSGKPGPTVDPNPSKKPGPTVDPNPSGKPGPTVNPNPNPSGKPGPTWNPNPNPSGNGNGDNGNNKNNGNGDYGYSGYDGAGNSGFNGIVTDNTPKIPSIYDKNANNNNSDNDDSASNNGVSDNSLSDNSLSDNSLSNDSVSDNVSDNGLGNGDGNGNGNGNGKLPWWVLLLIIIALMIIAYVVYRKKNGLPIIPEPVRVFFAGIFGKKDRDDKK